MVEASCKVVVTMIGLGMVVNIVELHTIVVEMVRCMVEATFDVALVHCIVEVVETMIDYRHTVVAFDVAWASGSLERY